MDMFRRNGAGQETMESVRMEERKSRVGMICGTERFWARSETATEWWMMTVVSQQWRMRWLNTLCSNLPDFNYSTLARSLSDSWASCYCITVSLILLCRGICIGLGYWTIFSNSAVQLFGCKYVTIKLSWVEFEYANMDDFVARCDFAQQAPAWTACNFVTFYFVAPCDVVASTGVWTSP